MFFSFLYNLLFPLVFIFFLPGLVIKYIRRPGEKSNYGERFGRFSREKAESLLKMRGAIWLHAVSVGETNLALTALEEWRKRCPDKHFILSTTTTTGQAIAKKRVPPGVEVIFCPIDFFPYVARTFLVIKPSALVIFETELWPNLLTCAKLYRIPLLLVNGRMSDKSYRGYHAFRCFFGGLLRKFDAICVQTSVDYERYVKVAPEMKDRVFVCGNIKFDQRAPDHLKIPDTAQWFGEGNFLKVLMCSTHPEEEVLMGAAFLKLREKHPEARLIVVPRHAERGADLLKKLSDLGLKVYRKSTGGAVPQGTDTLLADTTGELQGFIAASDIVLMGKTFAGNNEGQNIIEPAMLAKPVICGPDLKNFRQALQILTGAAGVVRTDDAGLADALMQLADDPAGRAALGKRAFDAIAANSGAIRKNLDVLEKYIS